MRAEVYLNEKLVGYSIMEELPFECDLTRSVDYGGRNFLAIRITNPFGRYDWADDSYGQGGAIRFQRSHGFGGLDRGMTISVHAAGRLKDAWVLNTPRLRTIRAIALIETLPHEVLNRVEWELIDPVAGKRIDQGTFRSKKISSTIKMGPGTDGARRNKVTALPASEVRTEQEISLANAKLWDINSPRIYHLRITALTSSGTDTRTIPFGFRWFGPSGLGNKAVFRLNGRRVKLYSAISWGFWGFNGLFPSPELAEKEVLQAKSLNLNCLNFHRNVGKEEVFRAQDRLGLLRYMEPGGGKFVTGVSIPLHRDTATASPPLSPPDFAQRFMFEKCLAMVKAFRSHPSLIQYTIQNELTARLKDPGILAILAALRIEDPSRCIVLNDGFSPPPRSDPQAWYEPYNDTLHRSDQQEFAGWWDKHQGGRDQWYDYLYADSRTFVYRSPYKKVLTEFGEMEGCASPDNHSGMIREIIKNGSGASYDLVDHQEIVAGYDKFLDKWKFREAFPATEDLWLSIGGKTYQTWQHYLENVRISDDLDFAVISGWKSTAIANHSGLVDNLRNFKSDPSPISGTLSPIRPVAKQRTACVALGELAFFDLYLLNDTVRAATGILTFSVITPSGRSVKIASFPVPYQLPEKFSYLIKEAVQTPPLIEEGLYKFRFSLSSVPSSTQTKEIWVSATWRSQRKRMRIGVSRITDKLREQLTALSDVIVEDFTPGVPYELVVSSGLISNTSIEQTAGDVTGFEYQPLTHAHFRAKGAEAVVTQTGALTQGVLEALRAGTPLLAIPQADVLSDGVATQLAAAGFFTYRGNVGVLRAPWMGNWYFVRRHPIYEGLPVDCAMGIHYQIKGDQSNGLLVDGPGVQIITAYSRDHDRRIGAGTFTASLGFSKMIFHRVPELHPVLQQRFLVNAVGWLAQ